MDKLDPRKFGLDGRTVLEWVDDHTMALVMDRKTRILLADTERILAKINKIHEIQADTDIVIKTSAPVCSKAVSFLDKSGVSIYPIMH